MLTRVDRVIVAVRDLGKGQRQAVSVLGLTPAWVGGYPGEQTESALFHLGNVCIELLSPVPEAESLSAKALEAHFEKKGDGLYALVFETDDIDGELERLAERGLTPTSAAEGLSKDEPSGAFRRFRQSWLPQDETGGIRIGLIQYSSLPEELPPSLATGHKDATVELGDHVVVMTTSPLRAIDLYGNKLGIRLALDKTFEKRGVRLMFFRLGEFTIEIGSRFKPDEGEETEERIRDDILWGLAYRVPSAEAARERISRAGLVVSNVRTGNKPGTRVCTVKGEPMGVPTLIIDAEDTD